MVEKHTIRIESILGGHSPTTHFARPDQFRTSLGINPAFPIDDDGESDPNAIFASGLLRPVAVSDFASSVVAAAPMWITPNPKNDRIYVFDSQGSVYSVGAAMRDPTGLGDLNDGQTARGDGAAYYDNYIYFACSTTIARYGPLDGTPAFTDDYWVTTLSKTRLTDNTLYPSDKLNGVDYPRHVLHRHSDGKLYIADVVDNKGTIHYIATTKTTVEGDTDNGSTYNKVQVGYGLWPTAMESYGSDLVVAFCEGTNNGTTSSDIIKSRAKLAFWDTTSTNVNKIIWVEFPDQLITALKNINGVLYAVSGNLGSYGFRISRFVGGYTFEDIYYSEDGQPPFPGAIDGTGDRVLFGTLINSPESSGGVMSWGLQKSTLGRGIFNVIRSTGNSAGQVNITSLALVQSSDLGNSTPVIGWTTGSNGVGNNGLDTSTGGSYNSAPSVWWSQMYRIGQPFKITKIRIPLAQAIAVNMTVIPKIYTDDGNGTTYTLTTINNTNYPNSERNIVYRLENVTAQHNFWLELRWTGSALCAVGLPITIEYELIDD